MTKGWFVYLAEINGYNILLNTNSPMRFNLFLIFIFFTNFAISQSSKNDSLEIQLKNVVVTAQYIPQSEKNAVYKVKTINSKIIKNKSANNLREVLQQELNIDLSQNSVFGTSVELQGISKENIKILIDGVPVIGRLNGIIDLNQINLANIEKIEIIEGPVSVFYGTDAMGGVINLITKKHINKKLTGILSSSYESINALNINSELGYKRGSYTVILNGGLYRFGGLSTNDAVRNLNWENRNQYFGNITFSKALKKINIRYSGGYSGEKLVSIGEKDKRGKIKDIDYYTRRLNNSIEIKNNFTGNKFYKLTLSFLDYQRYHNAYNVNPETFEKTLSKTDFKDNSLTKFNYGGINAQYGTKNNNHNIGYAIGTDTYFESTEGSRILDKKKSINNVAVFSSINFNLFNSLNIQPALRYTWNSAYGSVISPAFNAKIQLNENNQIRFSYAKGFRAPSLKELYLDFHISAGPITYIISGNEDLKVERSNSFNLNYFFDKNFDRIGNVSIETAVFYNDVNDLIALSEQVNFKRHYINIDRFKSIGGKINLTNRPIENLKLKTGFSLTSIYNKYNEKYGSDKYLTTPEFNGQIDYNLKGIGFNVYYKYSGKRAGFYLDKDSKSLIKTTRNSFNNLDIFLSKAFFSKKLKISLGAKNLFDVKDIETINQVGQAHARDMQLWGRSFIVKISYEL